VRDLERRGAIFVDELDEVPPGSTVVFSAHGVAPEIRQQAADRGFDVIDATCPLVTKVHTEARRFARRGDTVILIGHQGHEETEGTMGEVREQSRLVETPEDVERLEVDDPDRVAYLMQTTLSVEDSRDVVEALRRRFPNLSGPSSDDICYATSNRQHALSAVAASSDVVLVVGSANSSNSKRLVETAARHGRPAYLVDGADDVDPMWLAGAGTIGITAGASAPPVLVDQVLEAVRGLGPLEVEEHQVTTESVHFTLPKEVS
jgi:4-hydroxy-3-methylbut-2-enyl diphosphate reductase